MKLRIKFEKFGPVKYIGHLDIMRFFQKALRRAEVDVAYSTGFSPHQIMSFASPLGVGLESKGEYFDVDINTMVSSQEFMDKVNASSVYGIQVTDVRLLPEKAGNAMASVAAAGYTITFKEGKGFQEGWKEKFTEFINQEQILVTKKTKRGTAEIDLKPAMYDGKIVDDSIYLLVNASSEGNIKPSLVMDAFANFFGETLAEFAYHTTREETYGYMTDAEGTKKLVPLAEFGTWVD